MKKQDTYPYRSGEADKTDKLLDVVATAGQMIGGVSLVGISGLLLEVSEVSTKPDAVCLVSGMTAIAGILLVTRGMVEYVDIRKYRAESLRLEQIDQLNSLYELPDGDSPNL